MLDNPSFLYGFNFGFVRAKERTINIWNSCRNCVILNILILFGEKLCKNIWFRL